MPEDRSPERRESSPRPDPPAPDLLGLFAAFVRLGLVSFGGPAMVAHIQRMAVTRRRWLTEADFLQGVALCQAIPGATAIQSAAYVGLRARGARGAVCAFIGFGLPAFVLMLSLSIAYRQAAQIPAVVAMLAGLRALVVALVTHAAWTFARRSVRRPVDGLLALATGGLFYLGCSPFWIIVAAGLVGARLYAVPQTGARAGAPAQGPAVAPAPPAAPPPGWRALRGAALLFLAAVSLIGALALWDRSAVAIALVMMKIDLFAFGGGFAALPLMFREVVEAREWLPAGTFLDGIALGQVTPGPIVITATFVGHQVGGWAGALAGTLGVFSPSLCMVLLVEPWFRRYGTRPRVRGAIRALLLSFVGLLASVALRFGSLTPWNPPAAAIAALAATALFLRVDVLWVVLGGAVLSLVLL